MTKTLDADGHVIEPADLWERELPASLRDRGFHVRWTPDTRQEEVHVEDRCLLPFGIVGVGLAGRPFTYIGTGVRYAELHKGGFDPVPPKHNASSTRAPQVPRTLITQIRD